MINTINHLILILKQFNMKKTNKVVLLCALVFTVISFNQLITNKRPSYSNLTSNKVEALTDEELPPAEITCSAGNSGVCYLKAWREGLYGVCYFWCEATGDPDDYCSSFWVDLINFCTIIGGI